MSHLDIIRAWKDPWYRLSISTADQALPPTHRVGLIEHKRHAGKPRSGGMMLSRLCGFRVMLLIGLGLAVRPPLQSQVTGTGTPPKIPVWTGPSTLGNSSITEQPNGNIAIGPIDSARTQLHVFGRMSTGLDFQSAGAITFFPPDGQAWFHIDNGPAGGRPVGRLRFSFGNNPGDFEVMSINQNGQVAIGTANPSSGAKLVVEGDVEVNGDVSARGGKLATTGDTGALQTRLLEVANQLRELDSRDRGQNELLRAELLRMQDDMNRQIRELQNNVRELQNNVRELYQLVNRR